MIDEPNIDHRKRVLQLTRHSYVNRARLRQAGRMIMKEDECLRIVLERRFQYLTGIDVSPIDGAPEQILQGDEPMTGIEVDEPEDLEFPAT